MWSGRFQKLLAEPTLTFESAVTIALSMETADKGAEDLKAASGPTLQTPKVHQVKQSSSTRSHPPSQGKRPAASGGSTTKQSGKASYSQSRMRKGTLCFCCGGDHYGSQCRFKNVDCNYCGKTGHIEAACRIKKARAGSGNQCQNFHTVAEESTEEEDSDTLHAMKGGSNAPLVAELFIADCLVNMEVDTGASRTVIGETTYEQLWGKDRKPLRPSKANLLTYTGEKIRQAGKLRVHVRYKEQEIEGTLLVVQGNGPSLLGRDWLAKITLDWPSMNKVTASSAPEDVLKARSALFSKELGKLKGVKVSLYVKPDAQPKFCKARSVPFLLKDKIEKELTRLQETGVVEPVQFSKWAAPVVPVLKSDGTVRICGDFKTTVNSVSLTESYPLPKIEELFTKLSGGQYFSKLDLLHAYSQLELEESSREFVVINTPPGTFSLQ